MKSLLVAGATTAACLLSACGGGGGGNAGSAPSSMSIAEIQGFWTGAIAGNSLGASKTRAVVLENGATWLFLHDDTQAGEPLVGLTTVMLTASGESFAGPGNRYPASGNLLGTATVSGDDPGTGNLGLSVAVPATTASTMSLVYDVRYKAAAPQADAVGSWQYTKQSGSIVATWAIAADGALTGSSTLGCTYTGRVVPHPVPAAVYDATVTETCSGTTKQLTGIGKLNAAKTFLTFGLVTTDGAQAEAFAATKL
jgi:hypothetical protein